MKLSGLSEKLRGLARRVASFDRLGKAGLDLLAPEGRVVTIRRGAAAGLRWRRLHAYSHRIWLGLYEPELQRLLSAALEPGDVLWDVGCGPGIHSLVGWRRVGEAGRVVSIDPIPANVEVTRDQLRLNGFPDSAVLETALAAEAGTAELLIPERLGRSYLEGIEWDPADRGYRADTARLRVDTVRGDDLLASHPPPTCLKIDVEGSEVRVLEGCGAILAGPRPPRLLIEAHSAELAAGCRSILERAGYRLPPPRTGPAQAREVELIYADHPANPAP